MSSHYVETETASGRVIGRWINKDGKHTARLGVGIRWHAGFVDDQGKTQRSRGPAETLLFRLEPPVTHGEGGAVEALS
jgi:hypothetical protein